VHHNLTISISGFHFYCFQLPKFEFFKLYIWPPKSDFLFLNGFSSHKMFQGWFLKVAYARIPTMFIKQYGMFQLLYTHATERYKKFSHDIHHINHVLLYMSVTLHCRHSYCNSATWLVL